MNLKVDFKPRDFKPADLTLHEMVEKYVMGFDNEFQTPAQQDLRAKLTARLKSSIFDRKDVRAFVEGLKA